MRKIVIAGVAALGFVAVALTVMGHGACVRQAEADGSGADIRMSRHDLIAMIDTNRTKPLLVADGQTASRAHSLLVA